MKKFGALLFGILAYALAMSSFVYLVAFMLDYQVPRSMNAGTLVGQSRLPMALSVNAALFLIFGLQHSVMARPGFKAFWTRLVPQSIERSVYLVASVGALGLFFWQWRPLPQVLWDLSGPVGTPVMWSLYGFGWFFLVLSTFQLNHFDLFGLRQVFLNFKGRKATALAFKIPMLYRVVRHPIYVGWTIIVWATPVMTQGHLFFAVGMTGYMLLAIPLEERDLVAHFGARYRTYQFSTPKLLPGWGGNRFGRNSKAGLEGQSY